jgi:hypothetical protein
MHLLSSELELTFVIYSRYLLAESVGSNEKYRWANQVYPTSLEVFYPIHLFGGFVRLLVAILHPMAG